MRALAILLVMLLSACAVPPGGSILNPAPAEEPSPLEAVITLSKKIKSRIEKSFDAAKLAPLPIPEMARKYVYAD